MCESCKQKDIEIKNDKELMKSLLFRLEELIEKYKAIIK